MKFEEFLDVLCGFLADPVIYIKLSDSDHVKSLREQLDASEEKIKVLRSNVEALQSRYVQECSVNLRLKDELQNLKEGIL